MQDLQKRKEQVAREREDLLEKKLALDKLDLELIAEQEIIAAQLEMLKDTPRVSIVFSDNYGFIDCDKNLQKVKHFEVFSGESFNWGEDICSRIVDAHASTLEGVIYCPLSSKSEFIRPKYHARDRAGRRQTFPKLRFIYMNFVEAAVLPRDFGWDTPVLTKLSFRAFPLPSDEKMATRAKHAFSMYPTLVYVTFIEYSLKGDQPFIPLDELQPSASFTRE